MDEEVVKLLGFQTIVECWLLQAELDKYNKKDIN